MNKKYIPIILVSLSCLLFIVAIILILNMNHFEFSNKTTNKDSNQNQIKEENTNNSSETSNSDNNNISKNQSNENPINNNQHNSTTTENNNTESNNNVKEETKTETGATNNSSITENNLVTKDESSVISYFESQNNLITATSNQDDSSLREKIKNTFVTIIDFIFYDKEIKGYTFKELTTSAKLKIIKIALSIDNKIDKYFPDYKEVIKDKYDNIKGKLAVKYLEFTSTLCESVGEATCNQAKEDFNTMKENFGITWELIKELAKSGSSKVKEFYESWRDS